MQQSSKADLDPDSLILLKHSFLFASFFVFLSLMVSSHLIFKHLVNFNCPKFQLHICRLLLLVPIYAISSLFSLIFPNQSLLFYTIRDFYEGYTLYSFFSLLLAYLGGEESLADWLDIRPPIRHAWPLKHKLKPIQLGSNFLRTVKQGTLQFVFIKPCTAVIVLICDANGKYNPGYSLKDSYIYIVLIDNISVSISLYCLVLFYVSTEIKLMQFNPLPKFLVVKSVVFFSFWQACILQVFVWFDFLKSSDDANVVQNVLICFEMFLAAVIHTFAFPWQDYEEAAFKREEPLLSNLIKVLDVQDVIEDGREAFVYTHQVVEELDDQPATKPYDPFAE